MTETEFVRHLRNRCPRAYDRLLRENGPKLRALGLRILKCEFEAEDALQETLIRAMRGIDRFDGRSALSTWLYQIMINTCRMRLRSEASRQRSLRALAEQTRQEEAATFWGRASAREELLRLNVVLDELPIMYRAVVELRLLQELDTSTTAAHLGVQETVVKVRLHRARQMLKARAEERNLVIPKHDFS